MKNEYINISKASSSSLVERVGVNSTLNSFVPIKDIAQAKGLKSTRSIRIELNKPESKYISREVKVNSGTSYEISFSSLEPELQQKIRECEIKSMALVPYNGILNDDMKKVLLTLLLHQNKFGYNTAIHLR